MHIPIDLTPQELIDLCDLAPKVINGHVYMKIQYRIYRLPQAGILANKLRKEQLANDVATSKFLTCLSSSSMKLD